MASVLGPLLCATVATTDLAAHAEAYAATFGWKSVGEGVVDDGLARAWGVPGQAGAATRVLSAGPGRRGGVRFVETAEAASGLLRHPGWRSIEICVADVAAVRARVADGPFTIVGEPATLPGNDTIRAMQVIGPAGEMLYLTEVGPQSLYDLPTATELVDHVFIAVVSAPSLERARSFYETSFGATGPPGALTAPIESINRAVGLALEHEHTFCALQLEGQTLVEIDQHAPGLPQERMDEGAALPAGTALMTFGIDALDRPGVELVADPVLQTGAPYVRGLVATTRGPAGERIELVQPAA